MSWATWAACWATSPLETVSGSSIMGWGAEGSGTWGLGWTDRGRGGATAAGWLTGGTGANTGSGPGWGAGAEGSGATGA